MSNSSLPQRYHQRPASSSDDVDSLAVSRPDIEQCVLPPSHFLHAHESDQCSVA